MDEDDIDERGLFGERSSAPVAGRAGSPPRATRQHFHGHRDRLRERMQAAGAGALADYEILELLLFRSIPRADTKPIAKALIDRFGSLPEVLGAPAHLLAEVKGVGPSVAFELRLVAAAAERMMQGRIRGRPLLGSWGQVLDYCRAAMAFEPREQFRML